MRFRKLAKRMTVVRSGKNGKLDEVESMGERL